jgi:hypothetical protein
MNLTLIGNAIYVSMDIPDSFLAVMEHLICHAGTFLLLFNSSQNS